MAAGDKYFQDSPTIRDLLAKSEAKLASARSELLKANADLKARGIKPRPAVTIRDAVDQWEQPLTKDWVQGAVTDIMSDPWAYDPTGGAARSIAHALSVSRDRAPELFRGMAWPSRIEFTEFLQGMSPGRVIDLGVTSFSSDPKVSEDFLHEGFFSKGIKVLGNPISRNSVIVHVSPGKIGFNASAHSKYPDMKEWITTGKFRVARIIKADNWSRAPGVMHVYLDPAY